MINTKLIEAAYKELRRAQAVGDIIGISFEHGLSGFGGILVRRTDLIARFGDFYRIEPFSDKYPAKISFTTPNGVKWYALCLPEELTEEDWRRLNAWQE
jgi:hypothetical protein